jgi:cardiolipin synthase
MNIELLVNFPEFWSRLKEDIRSAELSIFIQTFALEGDNIGQQLSAALISAGARDKRILADSFTRIVLSDRFRYSPANLVDASLRREARDTSTMISRLQSAHVSFKFTNPYGALPRKLLSRNHKKLIVIDNRLAYVGGINFSEHNAAWHDMMLRIEDPTAVSFLHEDFLSTWNGVNRSAHETIGRLELFTADGRRNRPAFQPVMDLIDRARRSIFVESPYITFPFYDRLRAAIRRGVAVTVLTPQQNNWRFFANYARLESARSEIKLRLFTDGMSHLKAMLIDDEHLIAGSTNFDYLSYRTHQELIAILTIPEIIAAFRERVMLPDLARSVAVDCRASEFSKRWLGMQMRVVDAALNLLT